MNRKLVGASMLTVAVELDEQFLQLTNVRSDHGVHLKNTVETVNIGTEVQ